MPTVDGVMEDGEKLVEQKIVKNVKTPVVLSVLIILLIVIDV